MDKVLFLSSSLIFLSFVTKLVTSQSPLVNAFCHNRIQDPNFCLKIIGLDPRFRNAKTAHDLEAIIIVVGAEFVRGVDRKCEILLRREKDTTIKAALATCAGTYGLLKLNFQSIKEAFEKARPISQLGTDSTSAILKCNQEFDVKKVKSPLAKDNEDLLNFIQIIVGNGVPKLFKFH